MQDGRTEITVGIFVLLALAVFAYMGFQIGAFRFDRAKYNEYTLTFKDISGLTRKADVKIAGVKVGWVEDIKLHADGDLQPEVKIMLLRDYSLYSDAYGLVRQQGLLGPNYVEVIPGDPLMRKIHHGETLGKPSVTPVSIDELLHQFKKIATNVEDVSESFKVALGGAEGREQLRTLFDNINNAAQKLSSFSEVLERSFTRNEDNLNDILSIGKDLKRLSEKLETEVFPAVKDGFNKISTSFDTNFDRLANKLETTGDAIEQASLQARDGMKSLTSVAQKIDEGKGLIGKLINEEETYKDIKVAVSGLKNYFTKIDRIQIVFDSHVESMHRPGENYRWEDSKGFFDVRIHPSEDYFYLVQMSACERGYLDRHHIYKRYDDTNNNPINVDALVLSDADKLQYVFRQHLEVYNRNAVRWGIQFGKIFSSVALRFGMFEGFAGVGVDVNIPTGSDKFRWVSTLEAYDFTGQNRLNDRRPHFKWLNRMYIMRNIYLNFGVDDFASRRNANVFLGGGIRFGDDDVKFLLGGLAGGGVGGSSGSAPFLTGTSVVGH